MKRRLHQTLRWLRGLRQTLRNCQTEAEKAEESDEERTPGNIRGSEEVEKAAPDPERAEGPEADP